MDYRLLGPLEVIADDGRVVAFGGDKERVVLAALLLGANRVVSRSRLIDALWGERPPGRAANALQVQVSRLRKKLAAASGAREIVRNDGSGYVLTVGRGEFDVDRFEELMSAADGPSAEVSSRLREALSLWRGPALIDISCDVLRAEAVRLNELRWTALERRIDADLALGRHLVVVPELEQLVAEAPLREAFASQLMVALYRAGRQADALGLYRQTRAALAGQLGIDPSPALQSLELAILNQSRDLELSPPEGGRVTAGEGSAAQGVPDDRDSRLPSGTVTFLFSDVEGSTGRVREIGPDAYARELLTHRVVVRQVIADHDGFERGTEGDSFFVAFRRASDALAAAKEIQELLADGQLRVRIGVHTGEPVIADGDYVGLDVHKAARLCSAAHGGQVLVSQATADLAADVLPERARLLDLGFHRLRDLSRPERAFQLCHPHLQANFPPPRSLDARRHNLPVQRTSLVGRQAEMTEVRTLLISSALVTLVGSGGCGKTRLAMHVAAELLHQFPEGVWFADLAAVADPEAVATQAGQVFSLNPAPGSTPVEALVGYLTDKKVLMVLDNCEHVLEAAAELTDRLMSSCPGVRILATSRQPLALPGEITWRVPSLTVPGADTHNGLADVSDCEAAELFADRAALARPGFVLNDSNASAVAEVCRRLDGIPLAIELAAARVRVFTPAQIADGLDERFRLLTGAPRTALPRQQTLEASIEWSHHLLSDLERTVFRRLAVFAGTFDYMAARDVSGTDPIQTDQVLEVLTLLVDKSLVDVDDTGEAARYRLLETVRAFGLSRLQGSGEEAPVRDRHRDHYLSVAEEAEAHLEGHGQIEWFRSLHQDYPNLRAALDWSRDRGEAELLARGATPLVWFWAFRGPYHEAVAWLEHARSTEKLPTGLRIRILIGLGLLATGAVDPPTGLALSEEGLRLARELGDDRLIGRLAANLGAARFFTGQLDPILEEGIALARGTGDRFGLLLLLHHLVVACMNLDPSRARPPLEEALPVATLSGNQIFAGWLLARLGWVKWYEGRLREARHDLVQAIQQSTAIGDRLGIAIALTHLGSVLIESDDLSAVVQTADRLETTCQEGGIPYWAANAIVTRSRLALSQGDLQAAVRLGREASSDYPFVRMQGLDALVEAELAQNLADEAQVHLAQLDQVVGTLRNPFWGTHALILKARLARLQGNHREARAHADTAILSATRIGAQARIVDALEVLAGLGGEQGKSQEATRLFGATSRVRDTAGYRRTVTEQRADLARLRDVLGPEDFEATYSEGRDLDLDQALEWAASAFEETPAPEPVGPAPLPVEYRTL
jgi:predicted ATPase/class 3 adenylate cyclase/DNA-binding SARP family transcriptional activator